MLISIQRQIYLEGKTVPTTWSFIHLSASVIGLCVLETREIVVKCWIKEFALIDDETPFLWCSLKTGVRA